ncbi:hypothetical protein [Moritella sp. F3]|uniref:hypothetical protein n=1 Tax=Moritella sp. F3 TaxID=2718882 RepID=UPI0018E1462A|nr:hypothetical protein [Moritella sp. F3]GIC75606.1 hypothetical protein FMO001_03330 [Moritella sp. F1]GIC80751.1 hypothetical protein FMO003_10320 [Moritella sp. F3]
MIKIVNVKMSNANVENAGYRDLQDMLNDGWVDTWKLNISRLEEQDRVRVWNVRDQQFLDAKIKSVCANPPRIILGDDAGIFDMVMDWMAGPQLRKYTEE